MKGVKYEDTRFPEATVFIGLPSISRFRSG